MRRSSSSDAIAWDHTSTDPDAHTGKHTDSDADTTTGDADTSTSIAYAHPGGGVHGELRWSDSSGVAQRVVADHRNGTASGMGDLGGRT